MILNKKGDNDDSNNNNNNNNNNRSRGKVCVTINTNPDCAVKKYFLRSHKTQRIGDGFSAA